MNGSIPPFATPFAMPFAMSCAECEAVLSDYREGTLDAPSAAAVRQHLLGCETCTELFEAVAAAEESLAAMPRLEPPGALIHTILARTLPGPPARAVWQGARFWQPRQWWMAVTSPRFALGAAMSVFAVALALNAAQVNLRQAWSGMTVEQLADQMSPANLAAAAQRQWNRGWARGVSYYHDLRVVYEIEAAMHELRPPPPAANGHDRTRRMQPMLNPAPAVHAAGLAPAPGARSRASQWKDPS